MIQSQIDADPYETFATVYDLPAHGEIAAAFFQAVKPLLAKLPPATSILDVGCGTGKLTEMLALGGYTVCGVDRSPAMLKLAEKRCQRFAAKVELVCADLTSFVSGTKWPLALACGEIVNHLPALDVVEQILRRVAACLPPNGQFVFETLNRFCFEEYWDDHTYFYPGERGDVVMECSWDDNIRRAAARIIAFEKQGDHYVKREFVLHEYLHDEEKLHESLLRAGFREVNAQLWSPWNDQVSDADKDRVFWIATM